MAIEEKDVYDKQLHVFTFTVATDDSVILLSQISGLIIDKTATLEIISTADAVVRLDYQQSNQNDSTKMAPILDGSNNEIQDNIAIGNNSSIMTVDGVYFGIELNVLTATSGTVIITARI